MADYYNIRAPQWIDFAQNCSPVQTEDYFEQEHMIHEPINLEKCLEEHREKSSSSIAENVETAQPAPQIDLLSVNAQAQADLDIIKNTPVKVVSPKYRNKEAVEEATYEELFNDAVKKLERCKKMPKTRDVLNKSTIEPKIFKTPSMPNVIKSSRSVGCVLNKTHQINQDSAGKAATKIIKTASNYVKKMLVKESLFEQNKDTTETDTSNNPVNDFKDKDKQCNKEECKEEETNKECNEEDDTKEHEEDNIKECEEDDKKPQDEQVESADSIKAEKSNQDVDVRSNRSQPTIKQAAVLTWQNHRRSVCKRRTSVNKQYVCLAEAVSRFHTETPKRFRTKSNKDSKMSPSFYSLKLTQNRLKPTIPMSPALISKNRTRPVTVLSQEEREKQEMEEMKKYRIKANPIPPSVLRGPRATTKVNGVAKKVIAGNSSALQPDEKTKSSLQSKSPHRDKASSSKKVTKVVMTDSEGIIVEHEEMAFYGVPKNVTKHVTRVVPFSFETRNKNMQMKKEQRLKDMQEASKPKAEFHARPAPNFSKTSTPRFTRSLTPSAKQQQDAKRMVLPIPFSFEDRNKKLSERKEQMMKKMLEENKSRVFRANPAPVFKPVMVRGRSKEHLSVKNKNVKTVDEHDNAEYKCENQENKEPNEIDSCKTEGERMAKRCNDDKQKGPLKALPLELNTDKRAKERQAFEENLRRKEMEDEAKRQEEEKKQLEQDKQLKAELRKLAEVKARPMPKYKPPVIAKATKLLTNPQSPAFASKLKSKQKQETS